MSESYNRDSTKQIGIRESSWNVISRKERVGILEHGRLLGLIRYFGAQLDTVSFYNEPETKIHSVDYSVIWSFRSFREISRIFYSLYEIW